MITWHTCPDELITRALTTATEGQSCKGLRDGMGEPGTALHRAVACRDRSMAVVVPTFAYRLGRKMEGAAGPIL